MKLLLWKLRWDAHTQDTCVPRFTGWMTLVSDDQSESTTKTQITYLPPIHKPITDYATVAEYLKQTQTFAEKVNMPYVHLTLDVGAAAKAFHVVWNFPDEFENVIIHLGDFHLFQENFGIIGQFVNCSGFEDIVFQAGLCASGSLNKVLSGKHYNRAWTVHEHFADALERLLLRKFLESSGEIISMPPVLIDLSRSSPRPTDFVDLLKNEEAVSFQKKYEDFRKHIRQGNLGKTPQFWMMYLDMMDIQKLLHAAIKENDYEMRLLSWKNSVALFFAFNKHNYARYGSYYVHTMETMQPTAKSLIETRGLSVRRSHHNSARQAIDQAGEQTYNRSAKVPGGIKQFAGNQGAYEKWVLNRPQLAKMRDGLLEVTGLQSSMENPHKTCKPSEMKKSEQRVQAVLNVITNDFINPFTTDLDVTKLYNLSSGAPVASNIAESLTSVVDRGRARADAFSKQKMDDVQGKFFDPISKEPLQTFKDANQKVKLSVKGRVKELAIEKDILGKLVALSNKHNAPVDIDRVLFYCLGPVPVCLAQMVQDRKQ